MKKLLIVFFLISVTVPAFGKRLHYEKEYQAAWCNAKKGIMEYELPDYTRIDCLTDNEAVEFDFANKWAECIGQALYYGLSTDKTPACALILENGEADTKYLNRLKTVSDKHNIKIYTVTPNDL